MQNYGLKRYLVAPMAALAVGSLLLLTSPNASADQRDFTLRNTSSDTIMRFYVSPSTSDQWGDDQLGEEMVPPGSSYTLHFAEGDAGGTCQFDLQIVTSDGASTVESNVNLCTTSTVTYHD
jgi:hypothetical protein